MEIDNRKGLTGEEFLQIAGGHTVQEKRIEEMMGDTAEINKLMSQINAVNLFSPGSDEVRRLALEALAKNDALRKKIEIAQATQGDMTRILKDAGLIDPEK